MKKAQGLPLNVIILAILGLIVLVVLAVIFTKQTGNFSRASSCESRGGECIAQTGDCASVQGKPVRSFIACTVKNTNEDGICCLPEGRV